MTFRKVTVELMFQELSGAPTTGAAVVLQGVEAVFTFRTCL